MTISWIFPSFNSTRNRSYDISGRFTIFSADLRICRSTSTEDASAISSLTASSTSFKCPYYLIGTDRKETRVDVPLIVLICRILVLRVTTTFDWEAGAVALLANAPYPTAPGSRHCAATCERLTSCQLHVYNHRFWLCAGLLHARLLDRPFHYPSLHELGANW